MNLWQFCDRHIVFAGFFVFTTLAIVYDVTSGFHVIWRRKP